MLYHVTIGDRVIQVQLEGDRVLVDGADVGAASLVRMPGTAVRHLLLRGRSHTVVSRPDSAITDAWHLHLDGWPLQATVVDERTRAIRAMTGGAAAGHDVRPVRAPMPGLIVRIEVQPGDAVRAGQPVVTMEAMKMENELKVESDGVVARVLITPGQAVEKGTVLVELEAPAP